VKDKLTPGVRRHSFIQPLPGCIERTRRVERKIGPSRIYCGYNTDENYGIYHRSVSTLANYHYGGASDELFICSFIDQLSSFFNASKDKLDIAM